MPLKKKVSIFWFRRDLRLDDQAGLFHALRSSKSVLPIFIFDRNILDKLEHRQDRRVTFIHQTLDSMHAQLAEFGSGLRTFYGNPETVFKELMTEFEVETVFANHDYELYANLRDSSIRTLLTENGIDFQTFKDQVIFEKDEILSNTGTPYSIFTPYSNKWKAEFQPEMAQSYDNHPYADRYFQWQVKPIHSLEEMDFVPVSDHIPPSVVSNELIQNYADKRNFPAQPGTSRLSVHLRFGTISIRSLVRRAMEISETWLNELIWREFYMNILWHFPQVSEGKSYRKAYDSIPWRNNEQEFQAWCEGKTGYALVDAGMRELNTTGFMHNRVRMVVASFLVKHLLVDWRWGEAYFAEKLIDFDFSANNGGWQWASGSGCDAAPYFRVFNPLLQTEKFDKNRIYIKKWVPEYNSLSYMQNPIVNHELARNRVLEVYKQALSENG